MQFGQFINHDLDHVPNHQEDDCCKELQTFPDTFNEESCFPIKIPDDDVYFNSIGRTCMDFHRAMQSPNLKCEMGKREQVHIFLNKSTLLAIFRYCFIEHGSLQAWFIEFALKYLI